MEKPRHILIIDDDPVIAELAAKALGREGWRVDRAGGAVTGFQMAGRSRYDAILLDIEMPEIDGTSLLGVIRDHETTKGVAIVFFTANPEDARLYREHAAGIISKPFAAEGLAEQVRNVLGWRD